VRNLASRSAEAAREIKNIVENANHKANEGKLISGEMIKGYEELLENITKSTEMIDEISRASKEQEKGITQINDAVTGLDQQTQQNASIANQTREIALQTDSIAKEIGADKIKLQNLIPFGVEAQGVIDQYLKDNGGEVDYIHGDDVTRELGSKPGNMGFLLPAMGKEQLFKTVMADGVLPRKTFSMGHAQDKRYYIEARKIVK
jgi:methyl-accepting chemotaxis protein